MKRIALCVALAFALNLPAYSQNLQQKIVLPELHVIKEATLSPNYSCRQTEEFSHGYENTALFLSDYARQRNSPDLLFNGACGSKDYFQAATAGDDMALLADLGEGVSLEDVTASRVFDLRSVHSLNTYAKFSDSVEVKLNHTYAVHINKHHIRALLVFTVSDYVPNKKVALRYAVKSYQVVRIADESPGFDWERKNSQ